MVFNLVPTDRKWSTWKQTSKINNGNCSNKIGTITKKKKKSWAAPPAGMDCFYTWSFDRNLIGKSGINFARKGLKTKNT